MYASWTMSVVWEGQVASLTHPMSVRKTMEFIIYDRHQSFHGGTISISQFKQESGYSRVASIIHARIWSVRKLTTSMNI